MPKQLKVRSGERVDLVDYVHGSNTYTQDTAKFANERLLLDRKARILDGFKVRIEDQTTNPGMITVLNGNAINRQGQIVNNEGDVMDSRSVTLTGPNLTFYVELEFTQNETDIDARFFWDPTGPNPDPHHDGTEYTSNTATRLTPDWKIVTPVSVTGFEQSTNPNSQRIPLMVLATDASNKILPGVDNPGLNLVAHNTVTLADGKIGDTTIKVADVVGFPATTPFPVDILASGGLMSRTVVAADYDNGILTLGAALSADMTAGDRVLHTGTPYLVRAITDTNDPTFDYRLSPPGHPDIGQTFWRGDEVHGSGLLSDPEVGGNRTDLNTRSLKDQVDYLAAQLRDLKFGHPRPEITSDGPPMSFKTRPRWFDDAGSIQGSRTHSITIGDGVNSFGDFNGNDEVPFQEAFSYITTNLASYKGYASIFVKPGIYNLATDLTVPALTALSIHSDYATLKFAGTHKLISASTALVFTKLTLQSVGLATVLSTGTNAKFENCTVYGGLEATIGTTPRFRVYNSSLLSQVTGADDTARPSAYIYESVVVGLPTAFVTANARTIYIQNSWIYSTPTIVAPTAANLDDLAVTLDHCYLYYPSDPGNTTYHNHSVLNVLTATGTVNVTLTNNIIPMIANKDTALVNLGTSLSAESVVIHNNSIRVMSQTGPTNTSNPGAIVRSTGSTVSSLSVKENTISVWNNVYCMGVSLRNSLTSILTGSVNLTSNKFIGTLTSLDMFEFNTATLAVADNDIDMSGLVAVPGIPALYMYRSDIAPRVVAIEDNRVSHPTSVGVMVYATGAAASAVSITGNLVQNVHATSAGVSGIYAYLNNDTGSLSITDNTVDKVSYTVDASTTFAATAGGIMVGPRVAGSSTLVSGNRVSNIGSTLTKNVYGVYATGTLNAVIEGNTVTDIATEDSASSASGIRLDNLSNAKVCNNHISRISSQNGFDASLNGPAILVVQANNSSNVLIHNNTIDQTGGTAAKQRSSIVIASDVSATATGVSIKGNSITTSDNSWHAIRCADSVYKNLTISENVVSFASTENGPIGVVSVRLKSGSSDVVVQANLITERTRNGVSNVHKGIHVAGLDASVPRPLRVTVVNNTLARASGGSALTPGINRCGIFIDGSITRTVVSDNNIGWCGTGAVGASIRFDDTINGSTNNYHTCTGNTIDGNNDPTYGDVTIAGSYQQGILGLNLLVDGVIDPASPSGWDYTNNKLT